VDFRGRFESLRHYVTSVHMKKESWLVGNIASLRHICPHRASQSCPQPERALVLEVNFPFISPTDVLENPSLKSFRACLRITSYGWTHKHTTYHFEWKNDEEIQKKSSYKTVCAHIFISERKNYSSHKPPRLTEVNWSHKHERAFWVTSKSNEGHVNFFFQWILFGESRGKLLFLDLLKLV